MKGCLIALALLVAVIAAGGGLLVYSGYDVPLVGDSGPAENEGSGALATPRVEPEDSIRSCMERNLTPELLLSLYRDNTTLSNDIIRACLEQDLPRDLVGLIDPIIRQTSECASSTSQTLTTEEVLILGQESDSPDKDRVIQRVVRDILRCVAAEYNIPT